MPTKSPAKPNIDMSDCRDLIVITPPKPKFSQEIADEFCGNIIDGLTIEKASQKDGMPDMRSIYRWMEKHPEFRAQFERAVAFRNLCMMDACIDIADDTASDIKVMVEENGVKTFHNVPELTRQRAFKAAMRWKEIERMQINRGTGPQPASEIRHDEFDGKLVTHDPIYGPLLEWEIEAQKRRLRQEKAEAEAAANRARANTGGNGHGR